MPTTISPPTTLKFIQKEKNYVIGVKNQSAQNHQRERAHSAQSVQANTGLKRALCAKCATVYEKITCTSMNDAFMDLVGPSTTSGLTPNTI
jgi:hypothetical protein